MAELLLVGTTHYPPLIYPDEGMYSQLRKHVESDRTPPDMKIEANWPEAMQQEYGPNGANAEASAAAHRDRLVSSFRALRKEIDDFNPDFVLIWGDDQYENFREDLVPPFSIYISDAIRDAALSSKMVHSRWHPGLQRLGRVHRQDIHASRPPQRRQISDYQAAGVWLPDALLLQKPAL